MGFDRVGFLPFVALTQEYERLQQWLAQGQHGSMGWMADHGLFRQEPGRLVAGTQTIVCVAINYNPPPDSAPSPGMGKVARYARGKDYHKTIRRKLKRLLERVQAVAPDVQGRAFCDSAPLLEKALAVRAGLGWLGKHGLVIHPQLGSWLFLGELLLTCDVGLEAAEPLSSSSYLLPDTGHCGRCTRCMEACPTEAIVAPSVVDARRCIAYWTIENADEQLPQWLVPKLEGWAFGCDICQEVCPWNIRFASPTLEPDFAPRPGLSVLDPDRWLGMDQATFDRAVLNTPMRRTGLRRLQRNLRAAIIAASGP